VKPPEAFVVELHAAPWLQVTVTVDVPAKPLPVNVRTVATVPVDALRVSAAVTRTLALAESLDGRSVAVNAWEPVVAAGTVTAHEKLPAALVAAVQTVPPLHETVADAEAAKPVPTNVSGAPTGPEGDVTESLAVIENETLAVLPEPSVAEYACTPELPAGIAAVQANPPEPVDVWVQSVTPPGPVTDTEDDEAKFVPVNVTELPTGPEPELTVRTGTTVNVAVARFAAASVALNVDGPGGVAGILNVQEKLPAGPVVPEHAVEEPHVMLIVRPAANPLAESGTTVATGPRAAPRRSCGTTVNTVVENAPDGSDPLNVCAPAGDEGSVNAHEKLPTALDSPVHAVPNAHATVTGELGSYPVPVNTTEVPTGPEVPETERRVWTANEAVAEFPAPSVAVRVPTPAPIGARGNEQAKAPVAFEVCVQTVVPAQTTVTAEAAAKFDPVTLTVVPTGPEAGPTVRSGTIVSPTDAAFDAASVAVNAYTPGALEGTLKVHEKFPLAPVVPEHALPACQLTLIAEAAANPSAVNVTTAPTSPLVGETVRSDVTVTDVDAAFDERSVAVNECAPAVAAGSENEQANPPVEFVVWVHATPELHVTVSAEFAA